MSKTIIRTMIKQKKSRKSIGECEDFEIMEKRIIEF
ncbi:unnamed protein product [Paramecium pentaurelia]|uniref:Uncharacterized protein n=1 Tax=Paramecium pentaurelia TaxID=43138 RepID=A0A8S1WRS4_9CILI|nr:unnamed protein product [Paramecium pentaurelia]